MAKKAIDLWKVRQAEERLRKLLEEHPELRDPERQEALAEWLATLEEEDTTHGEDRETD
jgi:hypothetical protein